MFIHSVSGELKLTSGGETNEIGPADKIEVPQKELTSIFIVKGLAGQLVSS